MTTLTIPSPPQQPTIASPARASVELYGEAYQRHQANKYRQRATNHWRHRIALAHRLADQHALPRLAGRAPGDITVVDIGCSIGTFAIEFAKRGFRSIGADYDAAAIAVARELAAEEGAAPEFVVGDACELPGAREIDIAVCFDLFEHLHDDELGAMLGTLRRTLSPRGTLIFHTFPAEHDYLFYERHGYHRALIPFARLGPRAFDRVARAYAAMLDAWWILRRGATHREAIIPLQHCNPLTPARLRGILERAGFHILELGSANLYELEMPIVRRFGAHQIAQRNLFGAAAPKR